MTQELPQNVKRLSINPNVSVSLTERTVEDAQPRQKPYFLRDENLKGFAVKVNPTGSKVYVAEARVRGTGRNLRRTIGPVERHTLKDARLLAKDLLRQIAQGTDPKEAEDERRSKEMSIGELISSYYTHNRNIKDSRREQYIREAQTFLKPLINLTAADLSESKYLDFYRSNVKARPSYTDKIHRQLKSAYNYALRKKLVAHNPTIVIEKRDKPVLRPRREFIDLEVEFQPFMRALINEPIREAARDALLIFLCTGLRKEELLSMQWSEVDFTKYLITKEDTKNKHRHFVPMSHLVRTILTVRSRAEDRHPGWVFPNITGDGPIHDLRKPLSRVLKAAGIHRTIRLHDLRRTFTTLAQEEGLTEGEVKALLNHAPVTPVQKSYMIEAAPKMLKKRRGTLNDIANLLELSATGLRHGIRMKLYESGMFDEEKTAEGDVEYQFAEIKKYEEERLQRELTEQEEREIQDQHNAPRNLDLERAYS
jgi:integrase